MLRDESPDADVRQATSVHRVKGCQGIIFVPWLVSVWQDCGKEGSTLAR